MAKLSQIVKTQGKPKFAVRHRNRCNRCGDDNPRGAAPVRRDGTRRV